MQTCDKISMNTIHILLAGDEGIAPGLFVAAGSIAVSCRKRCQIIFHIMDTGLSRATVVAFQEYMRQFKATSLEIHPVDISVFKKANSYRGGHSAYARLLVARYVDADRVIYFDTDFLCMKDVGEFYSREMGDNIVLATKTPMYLSLADDCPFLPAEEASRFPYFNSGVLLIDLKKWRAAGIEKKLLECLAMPVKLGKHDQTLLNWVLKGEWGELDSSYGLLLCHDTENPEDTNFHFGGGGVKPWQKGCHYGAVPLWWAFYDSYVRKFYRFAADDVIRRHSLRLIMFAHIAMWFRPFLPIVFGPDKAKRMKKRDRFFRSFQRVAARIEGKKLEGAIH